MHRRLLTPISQVMTAKDAGLTRVLSLDWKGATAATKGASIEKYDEVIGEAIALLGGRAKPRRGLPGRMAGGHLCGVVSQHGRDSCDRRGPHRLPCGRTAHPRMDAGALTPGRPGVLPHHGASERRHPPGWVSAERLSRITCPLYLLAGQTDHITPPAQVFALADYVGTGPDDVSRRVAKGGHLGLFMGREHWLPVFREIAAR